MYPVMDANIPIAQLVQNVSGLRLPIETIHVPGLSEMCPATDANIPCAQIVQNVSWENDAKRKFTCSNRLRYSQGRALIGYP
jgi:hypothetical protein